jgi:uncharacterized protein (DUF58 family)
VLVTLGVGAAALNTGNNLLYLVLGLLLSLLFVSWILSDLALFWVRPSRSLPSRAHAKSPFLVEITLVNEKRFLPSFSIEVEDVAHGAPSDRRCYFLRIEPKGERKAVYRRTSDERGLLVFEKLILRTSYPFGLFEKTLAFDRADQLVVYPELIPDRMGLRRAEQRTEGESLSVAGHGLEPLGVREYRLGEPARSVHARRSASLGTLVVKQSAATRSAKVRLSLSDVVESDVPGEPWRAPFEDAVSRAAWTIVEAHGRGVDVEVHTQSGRSTRASAQGSLDPVLHFLALIEPIITVDLSASEPTQPTRSGRKSKKNAPSVEAQR